MKSLLLGSAALALSASFAMADTIRLGTEGAYPPYNFINDAGEVDGFERELGDELCKRAELTCEWVTNDWDSIIPNLLSGNYDAIIALGAVIRGGTPHFDYVAGEASSGLGAVSLETDVPVTFGVLTVDSIEQAIERSGTKAGNKGAEAAITALEMVSLFKKLGE